VQNTTYKVEWKEAAEDNLDELPSELALKIHDRLESHLVQAPKQLGKALVGQYKGLYRYRYGDYRILYGD
jgi:mRNA interferase RelE/StbE